MATNTAGTPAQELSFQAVHFHRQNISFADGVAKVKDIGWIPGGSQILHTLSGVYINTVWNSSGTALLDIGVSGNNDLYATDLDLKTAKAFIALDEAVTATDVNTFYVAVDTLLTAELVITGAPTTGNAVIVIAYIPNIGNQP